MNRITVFRILLVLYALCYVAALNSPGPVDLSRSPELRAYLEDLDILYGGFRPDLAWFIWLWLLGHLVELAGLLLLFRRVRRGLWLACAGAALSAGISWFVTRRESDLVLRSTNGHLLWSATSILWGGFVCMALIDRQNIFGTSPEA